MYTAHFLEYHSDLWESSSIKKGEITKDGLQQMNEFFIDDFCPMVLDFFVAMLVKGSNGF